MKPIAVILAALILQSQSAPLDTKGWRGIVPLLSTRADVEALLGEGTNQCKCSYYRDDMNLFFVYSSGDCESGGSGEWNIGPDTVIRFTIVPKARPRLSDLGLDESKFEKRPDIGDGQIYFDAENGFSMEVQRDSLTSVSYVQSFSYGPAKGDVYLRCPGYDGIYYSSSIPKELRPRLLEGLRQFVYYSTTMDYEEMYQLFLPEFASKMFGAKDKGGFSHWVRSSGAFNERFVQFTPESVTDVEDKTYGRVFEVLGLATTDEGGRTVRSYRRTRIMLRDKEWYIVDLFRLIPG